MAKLSGKTALITGAFQGVGLGVAEAFARAGAGVILHDRPGRDPADLCARMTDLGAAEVTVVAADLALPAEIDAMLAGLR